MQRTSAARLWGGSLTWWVFWVSLVCLFLVSYPPTTLTVHGIAGDVSFSIGVGVVLFTVLIFIIGIAQGIGKASVYRELADRCDYPLHVGLTEAGMGMKGTVASAAGLAILLDEGEHTSFPLRFEEGIPMRWQMSSTGSLVVQRRALNLPNQEA